MKKKRIAIIIIAVFTVVAVAGTIFGIKTYNDYITQQQIEKRLQDINDKYNDFKTETDRNKKFDILLSFIKDKPSTNDEISIKVLNSVEPKYNEIIEKMKKYFSDYYNGVVKDNTIKNIDKASKKSLNNNIKKLSNLLKDIESKKDIIFTNEQYKNYKDSIDKSIKSYNDQLDKIKKAEELKKKKVEEAKKKAKEEKNKKSSNSSLIMIMIIIPIIIVIMIIHHTMGILTILQIVIGLVLMIGKMKMETNFILIITLMDQQNVMMEALGIGKKLRMLF